ncbi:hypothetical protein HanXRQr2_Chr08g0339501 [Helianthus annuus]|uniref:Uncharacterized protein n=1 Tax=Helianthus annuus TaxID=4232 RepID=A0A9K3IFQ6_HELAN|nr:hypothetical protein HanXRQr2_Chr08g0339501 [Helianthus annuus]
MTRIAIQGSSSRINMILFSYNFKYCSYYHLNKISDYCPDKLLRFIKTIETYDTFNSCSPVFSSNSVSRLE